MIGYVAGGQLVLVYFNSLVNYETLAGMQILSRSLTCVEKNKLLELI